MDLLTQAPAGTIWWIIAALLVLAEIATGTFYLLMVAVGAAAGALATMAGLSLTGQLLVAAAVAGAAVLIWHRVRPRSALVPTEANRDVNLDVGRTIDVTAWDGNGWATVNYRGSAWRAKFAGEGIAKPGAYRIIAVQGNHLVLVHD